MSAIESLQPARLATFELADALVVGLHTIAPGIQLIVGAAHHPHCGDISKPRRDRFGRELAIAEDAIDVAGFHRLRQCVGAVGVREDQIEISLGQHPLHVR